ncbi:SusC/RagA family TonB-linked outer membrane protein [Dyadobacter sandarakinus]|uniref:SusC/RagA family TonB-linked outer membrane protein n=1 Tax=Dyadobacter sandarakinus TaxID=2747268 RepID=A0ABX7I5C2_9BACT|nr:SusC/RagA family TonB-linked outer membrane protein [Dyadobacter sandarakinus]QRR01277.1 SusC/RagA family TonB-linked outer membrane protein [Dyadobacter sandarakinus]
MILQLPFIRAVSACLLLFALYLPARAQRLSEVHGTVLDSLAQTGLPGVTVIVKGTQRGTTTNAGGQYSIEAASTDTLSFSFVGYGLKEMLVGNKTTIDIALQPSENALNELVVVGYGTMKKSDLTGAVIRLDAKTFKNQPMTQLSDMLTGTVAGFNANQNPSAAGGSSLQVRGPKSLNASTNPMVVVDGVIFNGSIADINPGDIETMDILKDASSAAVFGARAAGGVILITTKKGTTGKPVISVSANVGVATTTDEFKAFDKDGYLVFRRDVLRATNPDRPGFYYDNPSQLPSGVSIDQWRQASNNPQADNTQEWLSRLRFFPIETQNYLAGKTVDWYKEVMQTGLRQNYDVSIGGGAKNITYYWSLGYQNNEGVIRGDKFGTIRSRLNVDFKVTDWLNVGANTQFADRDESTVPANLGAMYQMSPYGSMFDDAGKIMWYPNSFTSVNPLINYYGQDRFRKINSLFTSIYGKLKLPFGFDYKLSYQPRYEVIKDYNFWSSATLEGGATRTNGYGLREDTSTFEFILDNLLHWNREFGVHHFDVTLLYSAERNRGWSSTMTNQGFVPNQNLGSHGLQYGTSPSVTTDDTQLTGDAAMARLNYTLFDKYLLTASIRRDGFSAFGTKQPRAFFPAAALAWKISEEKFFNLDFVSQMKLRLSYGVNGNRDIGAYSALAQLTSTQYYNGTGVQVGVFPTTLANPNLIWERTESINVGADMSFLKNRLDVSVEYYDMTTSNLLMRRLLPEITGFKNITTNLGELGNKGFEMTVNTVNTDRPNFTWRSGVVFSFNRNKIKRLFGDYSDQVVDGKTVRTELPDYTNQWFPGQALDRIWNYNITGIWQTSEKDAAAVYKLSPGDFKATDVDGNGKYEAIQDKQFIGYRQPRFRIGFRNEFTFFKNLTATVFLRSELGHKAPFAEGLRTGGSDTYDRRNTNDFAYWTPENGINDYPRLNNNTNVFGGGIQFYKPLSFVRLQDVNVGYSLPAALASKLRLDNLRIFASARNLLTFTKWPGWDPESWDEDGLNVPMPKNFTIGLNLSL